MTGFTCQLNDRKVLAQCLRNIRHSILGSNTDESGYPIIDESLMAEMTITETGGSILIKHLKEDALYHAEVSLDTCLTNIELVDNKSCTIHFVLDHFIQFIRFPNHLPVFDLSTWESYRMYTKNNSLYLQSIQDNNSDSATKGYIKVDQTDKK